MSRTVRHNHPSLRAYALGHYCPLPASLAHDLQFAQDRERRRSEQTDRTARDGKAMTRVDYRDRRYITRLRRHQRNHLVRIGRYDEAGPDKAIWRPHEL